MAETLKSTCVTLKENAPPDWNAVPFAVACARCGHDLHGRSEPTCPGCALTFRWADAVPIEQLTCTACGYHLYGLKEPRCPECATTFTWDKALANYHRQRKPLFEYQWRMKPVHALFRTWWLALRPKKLWTTLEMHDPVRVRPLATSFLLVMVCVIVLSVTADVLNAVASSAVFYIQHLPQIKNQGHSFLSFVSVTPFWVLKSLGMQHLFMVVPFYWLFWILNLAVALHIFQQSMHRNRLRSSHVWRVVVYAGILPGSVLALTDALISGNYTMLEVIAGWAQVRVYIAGLFVYGAAAALLCSLRSVALAYKYYIRMDHPWAVSIFAHVIAILLTLVVPIFVKPQGIGLRVLQEVGEAVGLFNY